MGGVGSGFQGRGSCSDVILTRTGEAADSLSLRIETWVLLQTVKRIKSGVV